jgi:protein SCO1/2
MKNIIMAVLCLVVSSCRPSEKTVQTEENTSEMSVFQLPSEWQTQDGKEVVLSDFQGNVLVTVLDWWRT